MLLARGPEGYARLSRALAEAHLAGGEKGRPAFDLADLAGRLRHRVSTPRAFATSPEIMLYDSPPGGLDPATATPIMDLVIKLRDCSHVSALLATHRLQDGYLLATHAWDDAMQASRWTSEGARHTSFLLLRHCRAIFDGSAAELRRDADPYVREFLS